MAAKYRGEPYAVAADVYAASGHAGQAGWTWYTGSSGWMYRIWIEEVLGFRLAGNTLRVTPTIPADWAGFEIRYRYRSTLYEITVQRCAALDIAVELDGQPLSAGIIALTDDGGVHKVTVRFS